MAYLGDAIDAHLAVASGDDPALFRELRAAFAESARRQLDLLGRARCDGNWEMAARRLKSLAATFHAEDLIAARVINGDLSAINPLIELMRAELKSDVLATLAVYLEQAPTIEACARTQFIHVNTVRYRLKKVHEVTGLDPADPKSALTLRIALMLDRKSQNL